MHALLLAVAIITTSDCPGDPQIVVVGDCPQWSPPVRCHKRPCAGCGGNLCKGCSQPYFGTEPYNYRIQFDYPWSQRPTCPPIGAAPCPTEMEFGEPVPAGIFDSRLSKPKTDLAARNAKIAKNKSAVRK